MTERRVPGSVERATRAELRALGVPVGGSARAAVAVELARRLDDPASTGVAAVARRLTDTMADIRSLRGPTVEVPDVDPAPAAEPEDAVAKARAARAARRAGA